MQAFWENRIVVPEWKDYAVAATKTSHPVYGELRTPDRRESGE